MSTELPLRVRWRERQTVLTDDLVAEQSTRLDRLRRHLRGHHRPGVITGLALGLEDMGVTVSPGVVVDAWGRTIVLTEERIVDRATLEQTFKRFDIDSLVLSISLDERTEAAAVKNSSRFGCEPAGLGRRSEACCLQLSTAASFSPVAPYLPVTDSEVGPSSIPLGSIRSQGAGVIYLPRPRAEAGLVAGRVEDPAGRAWIDLPAEPVKTRFEVAVQPPPDEKGASVDTATAVVPLSPVRRLTIDRDAATTVHGNTTVGQRLRLDESGPGPSQRVRFTPLATTPEQARPWSIYRTSFQSVDANGDPLGKARRQLRFEFGGPGKDGDSKAYLFAIGKHLGDDFLPCLRVDSECTLTVTSLAVEGQVAESPIPADPNDPRFQAAVGSAWLGGIGSALGQTASIALSIDLESAELELGDDLEFTATATNNGPAQLQDVRLFSSLIPVDGSDPSTLLGSVAVLVSGAETAAIRTYSALTIGEYQLVVSVLGVGPGLTPVAATEILDITVQTIIG